VRTPVKTAARSAVDDRKGTARAGRPDGRGGPHLAGAVSVAGLGKNYGGVQAVRDVSFEVGHGEIFALLGPNGAGKTSTLEILSGFRCRDSGQVAVLGFDPAARATARAFREQIGLVLQETAVEPYLTVRETVARNAGYYPAPREADEVISLVGLARQRRQKVRLLSGGQKRRLDLALGIIGHPRLLFLDEPTTGFDPGARRSAWELVRALRDQGTTILLTTHYMDEAQALADRVAVLAAGQIVAEGPPSQLGGRDTAQSRIRFALPAGVSPADLPAMLARDAAVTQAPGPDGGLVTLHTGQPVRVLHQLTGWATEHDVDLDRLTVDRPSLEDIYLRLTGGPEPGRPDERPADRHSAERNSR
jgi:ABC-2 type transport system ATP-binding protein